MNQETSLQIALANLLEHPEWRTFASERGGHLVSLEAWFYQMYFEGNNLVVCLNPTNGGSFICQRVRVAVDGTDIGGYMDNRGRITLRNIPDGEHVLTLEYDSNRVPFPSQNLCPPA